MWDPHPDAVWLGKLWYGLCFQKNPLSDLNVAEGTIKAGTALKGAAEHSDNFSKQIQTLVTVPGNIKISMPL